MTHSHNNHVNQHGTALDDEGAPPDDKDIPFALPGAVARAEAPQKRENSSMDNERTAITSEVRLPDGTLIEARHVRDVARARANSASEEEAVRLLMNGYAGSYDWTTAQRLLKHVPPLK